MIAFNVTKDGIRYRFYQGNNGSFHVIMPVKRAGKVVKGRVKDVLIPRSQFANAYRAYQKDLQAH